jgi:hypothetical protein
MKITHNCCFNLTRLQETPWKQCIYTFAALVTDQIRDAITAEAVSAAFAEPTDYVDFQNWETYLKKEWPHRLCFRTGF